MREKVQESDLRTWKAEEEAISCNAISGVKQTGAQLEIWTFLA